MPHTFLLSDESLNSYGFKVLTDGIDLSDFEKNPVMLLEHNPTQLIGRWVNLRKEDGRLLGVPEFDEDDELALKNKRKVEKGYLKGVSVGLIPQELGVVMDDQGKSVPVLIKSKLREGSLCSLPSNGNALKLYTADGEPLSEAELKLSLHNVLEKHHKNPLKMNIKPELMQFLGLSEGYTEDSLNQQLIALQSELTALRDQAEASSQHAIAALVDGAVQGGRIKAGQAEHFKTLAAKDFDGVKSILDQMPTPSKPIGHVQPQGTTTLSQRDDWDFEKWRKNDPKGLVQLKAEQPEKYAELIQTSLVKQSL